MSRNLVAEVSSVCYSAPIPRSLLPNAFKVENFAAVVHVESRFLSARKIWIEESFTCQRNRLMTSST